MTDNVRRDISALSTNTLDEIARELSSPYLTDVATLPQSPGVWTSRATNLERSIRVLRLALESVTDNDPNAAVHCYTLGWLLQQRFEFFGAVAKICNIEDAFPRHARERTLHPIRDSCPGMAEHLRDRSERPGALADLDEATSWVRRATVLLSDDYFAKPTFLDSLARLFVMRFDAHEELSDLEEAVELWKEALHLMHVVPRHCSRATEFFRSMERLRTDHLGDLEAAVAALRRSKPLPRNCRRLLKSAEMSSLGHYVLDIENAISCVVIYLIVRLEEIERGDSADLVPVTRCIAMLTPEINRDIKAKSWRDLGEELLFRFEHLHAPHDHLEALALSRRAMNLNSELVDPTIFVRLPYRVLNAGFRNSLDIPFDTARDTLAELKQVVHRLPREHPERAACLTAVGKAYLHCYIYFHRYTLLDESVAMHADAWKDHPSWDSQIALAAAMVDRCELLQDPSDFDMAIDYCESAVRLAKTDQDRATSLSTLGSAFLSRYKGGLASNQSDLDAAIYAYESAVQLSRQTPQFVAALGQAYRIAFEASNYTDLSSIDKALSCLTMLNPEPPLPPFEPPLPRIPALRSYMALGRCYVARSESPHRKSDDLTRALGIFRSAAAQSQEGDPSTSRLVALNEIVGILWLETCGIGSLPDALLPYSKDYTANPQSILAPITRQLRNDPTADDWAGPMKQPSDLIELCKASRDAVKTAGSLQSVLQAAQFHIQVCRLWRRALAQFSNRLPEVSFKFTYVSEERYAFQRCMEIVPQRAWIGHSIQRRYTEMASLCNLVRSAVAWATAEKDELALQWFEQGRAVVWRQLRTLRAHALGFPGFSDGFSSDARTFMTLSAQLEAAWRGGDESPIRMRRLASEYEELLGRLRSRPEFVDFVQPTLDHSQLVTITRSGPVVCINLCGEMEMSAAIVLCNGEVSAYVPLKGLSASMVQLWHRQLYSAISSRGSRVSGPVESSSGLLGFPVILRELWSVIVQPILSHGLHIHTETFWTAGVDLPHITWCTTGALGFLPLHAAGPYAESLPNAFDLVVSSYTPNLASLLPRPEPRTRGNILLVAQPSVDGYRHIPETDREVRDVSSQFPGVSTLIKGREATVDAVLAAMSSHAYVHLACHATQDPRDPTESGFILAGGHKLTLAKLMETLSDVGELAFLSACETATGDDVVPDEAVHLAAGMLAAGYRSVVGTIWPISDTYAPEVAADFYKALLTERGHSGHVDAARALHKAIAAFKAKTSVGENRFDLWVPFVHYGV